ncbi:hypothetical protein BCON_0154g00150 [Botryotinia convoluta]|uniref:Uncharacterized protein n=1 Tax=Botryotinia convoluta TaxID=54673 RepID=A0A4Z1HSD1_9HELO|nr:hypothetical protein BCON_0154g00150 [Botryotinia convoluta]
MPQESNPYGGSVGDDGRSRYAESVSDGERSPESIKTIKNPPGWKRGRKKTSRSVDDSKSTSVWVRDSKKYSGDKRGQRGGERDGGRDGENPPRSMKDVKKSSESVKGGENPPGSVKDGGRDGNKGEADDRRKNDDRDPVNDRKSQKYDKKRSADNGRKDNSGSHRLEEDDGQTLVSDGEYGDSKKVGRKMKERDKKEREERREKREEKDVEEEQKMEMGEEIETDLMTQDPIGSSMSTESDDETVRADPENGGRKMESDVRSEHRTRTSRSGQMDVPPPPSGDSDVTVTPRRVRSHVSTGSRTTSHKSDSRRGEEHDVKYKHSARPGDTERPVERSDSATNSDGGRGGKYEIQPNHKVRPQDSRSVVAPPNINNASTQKSSNHGSSAPKVAEKTQYKVPAYSHSKATEKKQLPYTVPVNLLPEGTSEDPNQEESATWKPRKISYQAQYTAVPNQFFTHK